MSVYMLTPSYCETQNLDFSTSFSRSKMPKKIASGEIAGKLDNIGRQSIPPKSGSLKLRLPVKQPIDHEFRRIFPIAIPVSLSE